MGAGEAYPGGAAASGQTVYYEVTANYTGGNDVPDSLTINWLNLDTGEMSADAITIWNTPSVLQP